MLAKAPHLTVRDNQANIVNTAQVEVLEAGTQNQAPVFQDRDGAVSLPQPFQVNTKGVISFYAEGGLYDLKITNDGDVTVLSDVAVGTAQSRDADGSGELLDSVFLQSVGAPQESNQVWQEGSDELQPAVVLNYTQGSESLAVQYDIESNEFVKIEKPQTPDPWNYGSYVEKTLIPVIDGKSVVLKADSGTNYFTFVDENGVVLQTPFEGASTSSYYFENGTLITVKPGASNQVRIIREVTDSAPVITLGENEFITSLSSDAQFVTTSFTGPAPDYVYRVRVLQVDESGFTELYNYNASADGRNIPVTDSVFDGSRLFYCDKFNNEIYVINLAAGETAATKITPSGQNGMDVNVFEDQGLVYVESTQAGSNYNAVYENGQVKFTVPFTGTETDIFKVSGNSVYIFSSAASDAGMREFNLTDGTLKREFMLPEFPRLFGDFLYTSSSGGEYQILNLATGAFKSVKEDATNFDFVFTVIPAITEKVNPIKTVKIPVGGSYYDFKSNKSEFGFKNIKDLGPALNVLKQEFDPATKPNSIFFQDVIASFGDTGFSNSVVIGGDATGIVSDGVLIGDGPYVDPGDGATPIEGPVVIGTGAGGYNSTAVVIGYYAYADHYTTGQEYNSSYGGIAIGDSAYLTGGKSVAIGNGTYMSPANVGHSIALGPDAQSYTDYAVSIGSNAQTYGLNSVAIGNESWSNNLDATAVGMTTIADADNGTAIGAYANINGKVNAVALGANTTAQEADTVAIGPRNLDIQGNGNGLIMRSPDGTVYDLTVDNTGALSVVARPAA